MPSDYFKFNPRETITYYPNGVVVDAESIEAVVIRDTTNPKMDALLQTVDLFLPRGSTTGRLSAVNLGKDKLDIVAKPYGSISRCLVTRLLSSDDDMWHIQVTV